MESQIIKNNQLRVDLIVCFALFVLAIVLFRENFLGHVWIGNPDRLHNGLKHMQYSLANQNLSIWSQHEMMGYDTSVLPFPKIFTAFLQLFNKDLLFPIMSYLAIIMLAVAGISAYALVQNIVGSGLAAFIAALCYQFSTLTVFNVSQSITSFALFIILPLGILCIRRIDRTNVIISFLILSLLIVPLVYIEIQQACYVVFLFSCYALFQSLWQKSYCTIAVFCLSLLFALFLCIPRIESIHSVFLGEYSRVIFGYDLRNFETLYNFQNIRWYEIWRWFDDTIFGRFPSDAVKMKNNINLTEGVMLYTSTIVPFLVIVGCFQSFFRSYRDKKILADMIFFSSVLLISILFIIWKVIREVVFYIFLKVDFTHTRSLSVALLSIAVLVSITLSWLKPPTQSKKDNNKSLIISGVLGVLVAILLNIGIEKISQYVSLIRGMTPVLKTNIANLNTEALARISLSLSFFLVAMSLLLIRSIDDFIKKIIFISLCFFIAIQCLLGADASINGQHVFNFQHPFYKGDIYYARTSEFIPPSQGQITNLHKRIQPNKYRVALICNPDIANGFCAGHVPTFWNLRAIDGYYGIGVPKRLRALPWPKSNISLRTISFTQLDEMPWELLGFLNVNSVLIVNNGVYRNIEVKNEEITGLAQPENFTIVHSPAKMVVPRVFFSQEVKSVVTKEQAVNKIFQPTGPLDPRNISFVEHFPLKRETFSTQGSIKLLGHGDRLIIRFPPAPTKRFLVLNELYFPNWQAESQGKLIKIYPTNAVMRGVIVPPGSDQITFSYKTASLHTNSKIFYTLAVMFLFIILFLLNRYRAKCNK